MNVDDLLGIFLELFLYLPSECEAVKTFLGKYDNYSAFMKDMGYDTDREVTGFVVEIEEQKQSVGKYFTCEKEIIEFKDKEVSDPGKGDIQKRYALLFQKVYEIYRDNDNVGLKDEVNKYWSINNRQLGLIIKALFSGGSGIFNSEVTKSFANINDHPIRFMSELIQNADDCNYSDKTAINELNIKFKKGNETKQVILEYPEIGFQFDDVIALAAINESKKNIDVVKTVNTIGEKGRGFKSIFVYFNEVEIQSRGYHFTFQEPRITVPIFKKNTEDFDGTRLTLTFKDKVEMSENESINIKDNFEELWKSIRLFYGADDIKSLYSSNPAFFTRNINKIVFEYEDINNPSNNETITITNEHYLVNDVGEKIEQNGIEWWGKPEICVSEYDKFFKCKGKMTLEVNNTKEKRISFIELSGLIKYLDYKEEKSVVRGRYPSITDDENMDKLCEMLHERSPIIMMGVDKIVDNDEEQDKTVNGHMYTFLPTSMTLNMPFIFHVPFKLVDNRSCPDNNAFNIYLLEHLWGEDLGDDSSILFKWYEIYLQDRDVFDYLPFKKNDEDINIIKPIENYEIEGFGENHYRAVSQDAVDSFNNEYTEHIQDLYREKLYIFGCYKKSELESDYSNWSNLRIIDSTIEKFDIKYDDGENKDVILNPYWDGYVESENNSEISRYKCSVEKINLEKVNAFYTFLNQKNCFLIKWTDILDKRKAPTVKEFYNGSFLEKFREIFLNVSTWKTNENDIWTEEEIKKEIKKAANGILVLSITPFEEEKQMWFFNDKVEWFYSDANKAETLYIVDDNKDPDLGRCVAIYNVPNKYKNNPIIKILMPPVKKMSGILCVENLLNYRMCQYRNINNDKYADVVNGIYNEKSKEEWEKIDFDKIFSSSLGLKVKLSYPYCLLTYFMAYLTEKCEEKQQVCVEYITDALLELLNAKNAEEHGRVIKQEVNLCRVEDNKIKNNLNYVEKERFSSENTYTKIQEENVNVCFCKTDNWPENCDFLVFSSKEQKIVLVKGTADSEIPLELLSEINSSLQEDPEELLFENIMTCIYSEKPSEKWEEYSYDNEIIPQKLKSKKGICDLIMVQRIRNIISSYFRNSSNSEKKNGIGDGSEETILNELLQNINDNIHEKENDITIDINDDNVTIVYKEKNGGFSAKDIAAIAGVRETTKSDDSIGGKGVGFKHIYSLFDRVEIYSNGYAFELDNNKGLNFDELIEKKEKDDVQKELLGAFLALKPEEDNNDNFKKYVNEVKSSNYYPIPHWIKADEKNMLNPGTTTFRLYAGNGKSDKLDAQDNAKTKIDRFYDEQISHIEDKIIFLNIKSVVINDNRT